MRKRWLLPLIIGLLIISACTVAILPQDAPPVTPIPTITPLVIVLTPTTPPTATLEPSATPEIPVTLEPTATLEVTALPPPAETQLPTQGAPAEPSPVPSELPTSAPAPTEAPAAAPAPFQLQAGTGRYIQAFTHTGEGCEWFGIGGQVLDTNGSGIPGLFMMAIGSIDGQPVAQTAMTVAESEYGQGGYELKLAGEPPTDSEGLSIQVFDAQGQALTDPTPFQMPDRCELNLLVINFQAVR